MRRTLLSPPPVAVQAAPSLSLAGATQVFLESRKAKGLSPRTLGFYQERLGVFLRWAQAARPEATTPGNITPSLLRDFLVAEAERTSRATARHGYSSLSAFFNFCEREGIVHPNPMRSVEPPRVPTKLVEPLTEEQVTRLLAACGDGFLGARCRAIILTLVDCGLRVSELCGLTLQGVDFEGQSLRVMGKGAKERVVPFGPTCKAALEQYLAKRGDLATDAFFVGCYGDPLPARQVAKVLADCGDRAGVAGVHPHLLRHTFALMMLTGGADAFSVQKALGHQTIQMTARYINLASSDLREAHRRSAPGDRFASALPKAGRRRLR